jgi:hypothetical protein
VRRRGDPEDLALAGAVIRYGKRGTVLVPLLVVAAVAGSTAAATSQASFAAQEANRTNAYAFTALYAPSSLTATPSGHDVSLGWAAGTNGSGYQVRGVANGSSSNCSGVTFATVGSTAGTSYTDTGRYTPQGTWFCYEVRTSYASWTSVTGNPVAAAQIGFVVTAVQATNGGTAGKLDQGDTIVFTFNQAVDTSSGAPAGYVCSTNSNPITIVIGTAVAAGSCNRTEATTLGTLTGGTSSTNGRFAATWAWSNGNKTLTVTIGNHTAGNFTTVGGTWTFNPTTVATNVLSATGSFHVCDTNVGGGSCLPTLTGSL